MAGEKENRQLRNVSTVSDMSHVTQNRSLACENCFSRLAPGDMCPYCRDSRSDAGQGDVLLRGTTLNGKFKIGRLLGRGGFGATYLAWDLNLEVRIAIKEFLPRQLVSRVPGVTEVSPYPGNEGAFDAGLRQFLMEARTLAQFRDHPGIISVLEFFPANGTGYMVMEYLDGTTLDQYLGESGPLDMTLAIQLLIPVADALRACHSVGLIHRDISPDNIFLTSDRRVLVLDFGAARFAVGQQSTNLSVILKEGYAPFEQYQRNGRQGAWTDIYALTATLFRLLTGELPPPAPDRIAGTPLPTLSEKGVKAVPRLQALVAKGMALQADQRYRTVDDFLRDLQGVLPQGTDFSKPPTQAGWLRDRRLVIGGLGAAALAVAAAVAVLWPGPRALPPEHRQVERTQPVEPPKEVAEVKPQPTPTTRVEPVVAPRPIMPPVVSPPVVTSPVVSPPAPVQPQPLPATRVDPVVVPPVVMPPVVMPPVVSPPVVASPVVSPPGPVPPQPGTSLNSMREYVKQGVQIQIQLRLVVTQTRRAATTLQKLNAISTRNETIDRSIQTEQRLYDAAVADQQPLLARYMSQIEWLAQHDPASVDAAIQVERDAVRTPSVDKYEADSKAEIARAIDLLTKHVRMQQQNQLTQGAILTSLNV
jgi:serine/threonine protein kinase